MKATDLLKEDHRVVDALFEQIESTAPSRHAAIFKKIKGELDTHAHIEEKIFYPRLKKQGNKELQDITAEGIEEHRQIKKFLRETARTTVTETREAKLKVLIEDTRHHVKEEEGEMFPLVEDQFSSEELETLGDRMMAEKKKFQKAKGIPARRQEPPKGMVATIVEKAKEMVASITGGGENENPPDSKRAKKAENGKAASKPSNGKAKGTAQSNGKSTSSAKPVAKKEGGRSTTRSRATSSK